MEGAAEPALLRSDADLRPDPNDRGGRWGLLALAGGVAVASLFGPLSSSGLWDPHELEVADLARRIAVALLGAEDLRIEGANNLVPTAGELGRGELPFTSIAVGLHVFGLREWAGRLPLALWGLIGLSATYLLMSRLADRVVGALSVLVLSTAPLYFLQARTILGDIVTMAALAVACAGMALALFDRRSGAGGRAVWLLAGVAGAAAGVGARGILVGVAVPALSVGLAWALTAGTGIFRERRSLGVAILLLGVVAAGIGGWSLMQATEGEFSRFLGSAVDRQRQLRTHDFVVHHLGHGLFPWSAVVPFALGRLLRPAPDPASHEQVGLRLTLLLTAILGVGAYGLMAPTIGHVPFGPVFALAGAAAIAFRDFERGAPGSRAMAIGVAALAVLLYKDFENFPEKGLTPFAVSDASFPESFKDQATTIIKYGTVLFSALFFFAFSERQADTQGHYFRRGDYLAWPRALKRSYGGNTLFVLVLLEVAFITLAVLGLLSDRHFHWKQFETMNVLLRTAIKYGFVALPASLFLPSIATAVRDAFRWFFERVRVTRGTAAAAAAAAFGAVLSLWYYPALAAQISPKEAFEAYRELAEPGEPLAMMGGGSGRASYYVGREVQSFSSANEAFRWLVENDSERRWLVARAEDLPQMNSLYRSHAKKNLPVLDARSSEVMLVSNRLEKGEQNDNPFSDWILSERPAPSRSVSANFGGQLEALGWEVTTLEGEPVSFVRPRERYQFRFYYEVKKPISGNWKTFIHVDGYQRRFNGDHDTLEGRYPFHFWKVGDYIVDIHDFELEPNFTPGTYQVHFGLFRGKRRLKVVSGPHKDDRVHAGPLEVR